MKEGFINFSRLKLVEAPENPVAVEKQGSETASVGGQTQREGTNRRREAQGLQMAAKTGSPTQATTIQKNVAERFAQIQQEKETARLLESQKSDWRKEITESLEDDPMEPEHPYVKVMPNIRYKQIEAEKELMAAAKDGKKPIKEDEDREVSRRARALKKAIAQSDKFGKDARKHHEKALRAKKSGKKDEAVRHQSNANKAANKARKAKSDAVSHDPVGSLKYSRKDKPQLTNKRYHSDIKTKKGRQNIVKRSMASKQLDT
jgi:hypothetical protein